MTLEDRVEALEARALVMDQVLRQFMEAWHDTSISHAQMHLTTHQRLEQLEIDTDYEWTPPED